jgi:hypothetical protein
MSDDNSLENFSPEELANMGKLYATLVNDPQTREVTLRATKKVSPKTAIPEIDVLDRVGQAVKPHIDRVTNLEQKLLQKDVEAKIEAKRSDLREMGHSKSEIDAIEKLMVEKQIPDHKTAAEFYSMQSKQTTPTPANWTNPNKIPLDREKSKAAGGFKKFFLQDAHQAVDEIRSGKIKLNS